MRKTISILLALAMIISMIPAVFASETEEAYMKEYGFTREALTGIPSGKNLLSTVTDYDTYKDADTTYTKNHGWKFFGYSGNLHTTKESNNASGTRIGSVHKFDSGGLNFKMNGAGIGTGNFALALQAPAFDKKGFYAPSITWKNLNNSVSFSWYMSPKVSDELLSDDTDDQYMISGSFIGEPKAADGTQSVRTFTSEKAIYVSGSEDIITTFELGKYNYTFHNITLTKILGADMKISVDEDTMTASVTVSGHTDVDGTEKTMPVSNGFITYSSDNEDVAAIDPKTGVITLGGEYGTATISAETSDGVKCSVEYKIEDPAAEPEDEAADGTVSFAQTTNINGFTEIDVDSVSRGGSVTLTAHKQNITGYKFVGWKRGADTSDENAWVNITGDTYTVWSNTYLTAVYEKEDDKNVAFWNQNGAYIGSMTESVYKEQTALFTPKLTGFGTFLGWFTDGNVEFTAKQTLAAGTTNAVAQYEASAVTGVTHNGAQVADAGTYNAPVELNKTNANTAWLRDGEPVAYGATYKFNVWDATNITEGTEEITDKVPVAVLDYSNTHKAYMLEYDAGDYEIVEAGIIFGKDTPSIKTYTSQRKEKHNQFTVPEEGALEATGYIIYTLDGGASYKTKYVSVKTAN